jgi:hypothetical protein
MYRVRKPPAKAEISPQGKIKKQTTEDTKEHRGKKFLATVNSSRHEKNFTNSSKEKNQKLPQRTQCSGATTKPFNHRGHRGTQRKPATTDLH